MVIALLIVLVMAALAMIIRSSVSPEQSVAAQHAVSTGPRREIDGRRVTGWDAYFAKHLYCTPDALRKFPPPHYSWDTLSSELSHRLSEYVAPSYGVLDTYEEHVVFRLVYDIYQSGRELERSKDYASALDCYLLILFSVVPLGDSYYVRPAILLERFKQYEAAIIVCKMRYRHLRTELMGANKENKEAAFSEWKKREARLNDKLRNYRLNR